MVLASLAMASAATSSSREAPSLVQVRESNFLTKISKTSSLEHAEELVVHLRQMAMAKVTKGRNGSVQPNYTVFQLDENASEATLQIINNSMASFLEQVNTSFHNDLREIELLVQNAEECNQDLFDQTAALNLNVTSVNASVVAAENQHDLCRIEQNATNNQNVTTFNALKSKVDSQLQRIDLDESQANQTFSSGGFNMIHVNSKLFGVTGCWWFLGFCFSHFAVRFPCFAFKNMFWHVQVPEGALAWGTTWGHTNPASLETTRILRNTQTPLSAPRRSKIGRLSSPPSWEAASPTTRLLIRRMQTRSTTAIPSNENMKTASAATGQISSICVVDWIVALNMLRHCIQPPVLWS